MHVFSAAELAENRFEYLGQCLTEKLSGLMQRFHVVIGRQVKSYRELSHSYNTAIINLQQCFFMEDNICVLYRHIPGKTEFKSLNGSDRFREFKNLLTEHREKELIDYLEQMKEGFVEGGYILPNQAREFYYRLFQIVLETGAEQKLEQEKYLPDRNLWESISHCHSIFELHDMLAESTRRFLEGSREAITESALVYAIKTYISENYRDPNLSIMAISEHVHLSGSYICTLFKSECQITLNQYITEYRLDKARELLSDPRNRILEIAGQVGYADSNYFSKIFRKSFGLSPSEYRKQQGV